MTNDDRLNHRIVPNGGVLRDECADLLQRFFAQQRALGNN